jgi:hypothetical protein
MSFELHAATADAEVGGGLMATTTSSAVAERWEASGGVVVDTKEAQR